MPLIESEDYPNKRIHLSVDAIAGELQPMDIYREHRARRRLNANGERKFAPMVGAFGNDQIGASKFTPRFTNLASGVKLVPYDTTSNLIVVGALISTVDQLEGVALFDRSSLVATVDIDYIPPQVEIITVNTGSVDAGDLAAAVQAILNNDFAELNASITAIHQHQGMAPGIRANVLDAKASSPGRVRVLDGNNTVLWSQTLTLEDDGSVSVELDP